MVLRWTATLLSIAVLLFVARGNAQTAGTGNIQGSVTDTTGAVVQNATVTATNTATQMQHVAVTDNNGLYSFPNLAIGTYTVEVTAPTFARYRQSNIVLDVGSSIAVNPSLKAGGTSQTVEVQAAGLALQTEDSSLKQTIDENTLTEMPLNGRQMTSLITLTGGAVNANENNDQSGSKTFYSSAVISIGGGQGNATDYRLDGGDNNDYMTNVNMPFPFPDAVAEFSVETAALGAQSGLHPGGLVNVVTRSGTSTYHGSGFEFIRNNFIDATNFFSTTKDTLHQNQFGGTFGGKIYRDKLFGFVGYQRWVNAQTQSNTTSYVPTAANLTGDFSATDTGQLLDPLTGIALVGNKYAGTPGVTWNPSPAALKLVKYLPATTDPGGKVTYAIPSQVRENQFVTRVDANLSANNSLYARYFLDGYQFPAFYSPTNILITTSAGNSERAQSLTLGETYIMSKNLVNSAHATVMRRRDDRGPNAGGINSSSVGVNIYDMTTIGMQLTVTNKWSMYCGTCSAAKFNVNTLALADDVNWSHGKHQIAFGGEWVQTELNVNNVYQGNGNFTFNGLYSQKGPAGSSPGGTVADQNLEFLVGAMSAFSQSKAQQNALREPIPSLYIQDTYHMTNRLVLNGGVRWDPEYVATDYFNRGSVFNMSNFLAGGPISTVYPNAPAGSLFYGDKGVPKAFTQNSPWQFSPRIGATFDPKGDGKMVFRVGAALVYDEPNLFTGQRNQQNPPFAQSVGNTPVGKPLSFDSPWSNGAVTTNPFPLAQIPTSSVAFQKQSQYIVMPTKFHSPYMMQWTASIQREVGRGWEAQLSYVGNETAFGPYGLPMNPAVYAPGTCGTTACSTTGNYASRFALTEANATWGPYYQGGGSGSMYIMAGANASYHGMVASIQHRSSTFVFIANYTWAHCIDISDNAADVSTITVQNPANIKGDKSSCGFDFRHVINTTVVASTHFNSLHGITSGLVNHWQISPLVHATDGNPFTVTSGVDNSLIDVNNDRPNVTNKSLIYSHAKISSGASTNAQYLSPASAGAFTQNAAGTFGNSGRFAYRGPKFLQVDSALTRTFPLHDAFALNLRFEAFNLLNHPDFAAPGSSAGYLASSTALNAKTFGQVTSTVNGYGARIFQGAVKVTF
ncbi:MAG: carboxypeptidase-like regulatory domain-containing protein [Formivibrio sp.]|nr:carboxypeptidase-like regulatory domain-containing protein [Formivibrio sp.]